MSDAPQDEASPGVFARIGNWFKGDPKGEPKVDVIEPPTGLARAEPPRSFFPWSKRNQRDQAIANMQQGFNALTDLMTGIHEGLTDQGRRQDELLKYLSHLPQAIQSIPENNRLQGEAIKAIGSRLEQTNEQQRLIAEILNKVHDAGQENRKTVEEVRDRVDSMAEHERKISDNLSSVGSAMQSVSRNSQASAQVLEQMRDNISSRDGQMEIILRKQEQRFTLLMTVAIILSIAALAAVAVVGYLALNRPSVSPPAMTVPQQTHAPDAMPNQGSTTPQGLSVRGVG